MPILAALDDHSLPSTLETNAQYFSAIPLKLHSRLQQEAWRQTAGLPHLRHEGLRRDGSDGTPGVRPVTEADPLDPPAVTSERALHCDKILEHGDIFDAAVIRPPNLYGYSGSGYGYFFKKAEEAEKVGVLEFAADARSIFHSAHVDDCAEACVALSQDQVRIQVWQQVFNIAGSRYETLGQIAGALVGEYGVFGGAKFQPKKKNVKKGLEHFIAKFS
ncbi:hypothetical protein B0J12DRAFT_732598 [Macrophomina phaseolina]|uniref:NAD-dependent epimerase/dehydratase n=1 Tax=Macrophomina phaseolina TaxID=35725 RepID=A0ABQ8FVD4_9PEZI|nr:hypothetical protein B0J12DRAFT_732598 [Macrophomina phaseolina]